MGWDGTSGTSCLRCPIYACIHWWTMWTNCPRPAPIATNWPLQGRVIYGTGHGTQDMGHRTKQDIFAELAYIPKKFFGTTTKCSSRKGLRTTRCAHVSAVRRHTSRFIEASFSRVLLSQQDVQFALLFSIYETHWVSFWNKTQPDHLMSDFSVSLEYLIQRKRNFGIFPNVPAQLVELTAEEILTEHHAHKHTRTST